MITAVYLKKIYAKLEELNCCKTRKQPKNQEQGIYSKTKLYFTKNIWE